MSNPACVTVSKRRKPRLGIVIDQILVSWTSVLSQVTCQDTRYNQSARDTSEASNSSTI